MTMQVYSAAEFTCTIGAIKIDQGALGPDDAYKLTQNTKAYKLRSGVGGGKTRSQTLNPDYILTVKVRQTDPVNSALSALHNLDKVTPGGSGIVPVYLADRLGNLAVVETEAFIDGDPEMTAGAEEGDLEWTVVLPSPKVFMGGH